VIYREFYGPPEGAPVQPPTVQIPPAQAPPSAEGA